MASDRLQRRLDALLDEADEAIVARDWDTVRARAEAALAIDPDNADARAYLDTAARGAQRSPPTVGRRRTATAPRARELPESFVAGRYRVTDFLGEGVRKQVYLARDGRLNRDVAFAVIKTEGLDATGRERVTREAQAMGQLSGDPHIVTIHDVGETDSHPYIVSEYMAGGDLEAVLADAEQHQLPLERALAIADDVAQALAHAHAAGVVHRDLKPGNIWLAEDGTAKLGDFGLAFAASETRMTTAGTMLGTVAYMPPEQALGQPATPQSDLYALGCVLYEMVTGRQPFLGEDAVAIISQHLNTAPVAPSWRRNDCPIALEQLIQSLLAKDPADRPGSAAAVSAELERVDLTSPAPAAVRQNPLERLARGVFVGRDGELQRLRRALDASLGGHGQLVMLVGEPGIGKTRTALELQTYARMRGAQVLWGRIHEGSGAPPYWPWIQIGRAWGRANDASALGLSGETTGELVRLFPDLKEIVDAPDPPPIQDPEAAQFRLFDAYTTFLRAAAESAPLVLVVDDVHWADKPSLQLLQHLARELAGLRALVVSTFRDTDLVRTHPLSETLAALNREAGFERIVLRGLTPDEVRAYIRSAANVDPAPAVLSKIVEETEGNPFFLAEVVNLMAQEGTIDATSLSDIRIPDGVREALGRRLDRLSDGADQLLQIAAVMGREFPFETLALVSGVTEDATLLLVEEALEARIIEELDRPGRYRFTHHLMQETLLDELSTTRRIRLHGQIGEALEARYGNRAEDRAPVLARHFAEAATLSAGLAQRAIRYGIRAAEQAAAAEGWAEATRHYERCLSLIDAGMGDDGIDAAALQLNLGQCASNAGDRQTMLDAMNRALDEYEARGDGVGMARAALLARDPRILVLDTRIGVAKRALAQLGNEDPHLRAQLLLQAAMYEFDDESVGFVREGSALAERYGYFDVQAYVLDRETHITWDRGDIEGAVTLAGETAEAYERAGLPTEVSHMLGDVSWTLLQLGRLDHALAAVEEEVTYARGHYLRAHEHHALVTRATIARQRGERDVWQQLESHVEWPNFGLVRATDAEARGDLDSAESCARDSLGAGNWFRPIDHAVLARFAWLRGDTERAREELKSWRALVSHAHLFGVFRDESYAQATDPLVAVADDADVRDTWSELDALPQLRCSGYTATGMDRVRGELALRLGDLDAARQFLQRGRTWAEKERCGIEAGLCELGLARVALARSEPELARHHLNQGTEALRRAGADGYLERAVRLRLELQHADTSGASIDAVAASIDAERPDLTAQAAPDGTVTLLFSDIENSTARTAELGDAQWMELLREHNTIVREQLAAHGGYEVKSMGDGFMLAFRSAVDGLHCAIAMQRAFAERNATATEPIQVRIGLHTGEAIREADDFFGTHVNLAARIGGAAKGDEILVSGLLKALTESAGEFTFEAGRDVPLKGITGPQRVYAVTWR